MTELEQFDYDLPEELIAVTPAQRRDESRLMVLDRDTGRVKHGRFHELPDYLREGDVVVMNDARVVPARLHARRDTGGAVEVMLLRQVEDGPHGERHWLAMVRAGGSIQPGEQLALEASDDVVTLVARHGGGQWTVSLGREDLQERILEQGSMPLPPYIVKARKRRGMPEEMPELDRERYQTVYARNDGAVAAPTAGLHFTPGLIEKLRESGVETHLLTLLVGPGTFKPVRTERIEDHELDAEFYHLPADTARAVATARGAGRRVIAVGTTTCRVLEYVAGQDRWDEHEGWTDAYIYPPYEFRAIDGLITNFHLPRSTLIMLVSALAGRENVMAAYRQAVEERYRFYSYGDAMLIV
jgi:S-adenosylmethionine:tRNA ribosyltransferase-isomerase